MVRIDIDDSKFRGVAEKLLSMTNNMPKSIRQATHKALDQSKPEAQSMIEARYNVSAAGKLTVKKEPTGGSIEGKGGMITVDQFNPQELEGGAVSVEIIRGSRKVISPTSRGPGISGAFVAAGKIMERRQVQRFPIYPVWTIGIPQMLGYRGISDPLHDKIGERSMMEIREKFFEV